MATSISGARKARRRGWRDSPGGRLRSMELTGATALLTGSTGGLGRAIARALADRGAALVLSGRSAEALEQLAGELPGEGHITIPADLAQAGAASKLAAHPRRGQGLGRHARRPR